MLKNPAAAICYLLFAICYLLSPIGRSPAHASPLSHRNIPVTRWIDDGQGSRPGTFREWQQSNPVAPEFKIARRMTTGNSFDPRLDIIVNSVLFDSIAASLDTLGTDIALEGFAVSVFTMTGGTPESLRAFLTGQHDSGMVGALLVGTLPIAWFQMVDDWDGNGRRDPGENYEEFPCDLYYMDLNGTWLDTMQRVPGQDSMVRGHDGIYDQHDGNLVPEIWVARITARPCGNEPLLVQSYLGKVHSYRTGGIALNDRALVFVDDDWTPWSTEFYDNMGLLYPNRVLIDNVETTQVTRYRQCLTEDYQWIGLYSHSSSRLHAMKYNNGNSWSYMYEPEIPTRNPIANFYNLFACSNARYTDTGYMAGRYIYSTSTGLISIGTTKTGSMLDFGNFYAPLGDGQRMGEAFMTWFQAELAGGYDPVNRSWFYGMCLNGDPTLKPRLPVHDVGVSAIIAPAGTIDSGTAVTPVCRVTNHGVSDETFTVRFKIGTGYVEMRSKTLAHGAADTMTFPTWIASPVGVVTTRCSTELSTDTRSENDAMSSWVTVRHPTGVAENPVPFAIALSAVTPNPTSGQALVCFALPFGARVRLGLYDCRGALVRPLVSGPQPAGEHSISFPASDRSGHPLPSGIYLLRFEAAGHVETRRLAVIR